MESLATIVKSNKGTNDKIYYGGYEYIKDGENKSKTKTYHCCADYKKLKCPARMIRDLNQDVENQFNVTKEHTHSGNGVAVGKAVAMRTLKRKAEDSLDRGRNVIAKLNENLPVSVAAALPKMKSLSQAVRRARVNKEMPLAPANLNDLVIPDNLKTIKDVRFLLYDSGPSPNRILIYSTERNLQMLRKSDVLSMDGTFDIVPPLFSQLYTMQGLSLHY
ncbi:hypothetical protein HA402_006574 [Bradysia odoriphaga]|nr:hypothetical protein HA402_006574 [Bradysia odoriphaga]